MHQFTLSRVSNNNNNTSSTHHNFTLLSISTFIFPLTLNRNKTTEDEYFFSANVSLVLFLLCTLATPHSMCPYICPYTLPHLSLIHISIFNFIQNFIQFSTKYKYYNPTLMRVPIGFKTNVQ